MTCRFLFEQRQFHGAAGENLKSAKVTIFLFTLAILTDSSVDP